MKLMSPKNLVFTALLPLFIFSLIFAGNASAQSKKKADNKKVAAKKADAKKKEKVAKDARKDKSKAKTTAKRDLKKDSKKEKIAAKDKKANSKSKKERSAAAAERRRIEAERRAAVAAERRRREQARREAIARKLAFERGLRTETVANIATDKTEGEDLNIRNVAINALGEHAGSVVVMEAQTGKVLTIVNQNWAVRDSIKPCSTIKLVTGVAGIKENAIAPEDGSLRITPSRLKLDDALAFSNNGYFQWVGKTIGNEKMIATARELGLGEPTGINLEGETAGKLAIGNNNPRIYSHGDDFEVSTLQLAVMVSAIANGGNRVLPRVPRNTIEKTNFQTFYRDTVDLPQKSVRRVIPGMMGAAEYGTARRGADQNLGVAGKTGSCIGKGSWVGLFASVAPIEQPKYAVAVITRGQRERGRIAAGIAHKIYQALASQIVRTDRNLAWTEFKLRPRGYVEPQTALAASEEEDDAGTEATTANVILVPAAPATKKTVIKTVNSKPTNFPPVVITYDKEPKEAGLEEPKKPE